MVIYVVTSHYYDEQLRAFKHNILRSYKDASSAINYILRGAEIVFDAKLVEKELKEEGCVDIHDGYTIWTIDQTILK